jgi:hypothetical protein
MHAVEHDVEVPVSGVAVAHHQRLVLLKPRQLKRLQRDLALHLLGGPFALVPRDHQVVDRLLAARR